MVRTTDPSRPDERMGRTDDRMARMGDLSRPDKDPITHVGLDVPSESGSHGSGPDNHLQVSWQLPSSASVPRVSPAQTVGLPSDWTTSFSVSELLPSVLSGIQQDRVRRIHHGLNLQPLLRPSDSDSCFISSRTPVSSLSSDIWFLIPLGILV